MSNKLHNPPNNEQPNNNIPNLTLLIVPQQPIPGQGTQYNKPAHKHSRTDRYTQIEQNSQHNSNMKCPKSIPGNLEM